MVEETRDLFQEYADAHCGGDRRQAVYRLMTEDEASVTEEMMATIPPEEVEFALLGYELQGIRNYGGKENYKIIARIHDLRGKLGAGQLDPTTLPNPFGKEIWVDILRILGVVLIPAVLIFLYPALGESLGLLIAMGGILTTIGLLRSVQQYVRYNQLLALWKKMPNQTPVEPPTFQQCQQFITANQGRSIFWQDVVAASARQKKANWVELAILPLFFVVMTLLLAIGQNFGIVGRVMGAALTLVVAFWRVFTLLNHKNQVAQLYDCVPNTLRKLQLKKQCSGGHLATNLLLGVYALLVFAGMFAIITV